MNPRGPSTEATPSIREPARCAPPHHGELLPAAKRSLHDELVQRRRSRLHANSGANQQALETKLAALEGGEAAAVFATGVAALHGMFFTLLKSGDHIVVSNVTYEAVWRLFSELLPQKYGIEATFVDVADLDAVRAAIRPNTRLVHVETIANPLPGSPI